MTRDRERAVAGQKTARRSHGVWVPGLVSVPSCIETSGTPGVTLAMRSRSFDVT